MEQTDPALVAASAVASDWLLVALQATPAERLKCLVAPEGGPSLHSVHRCGPQDRRWPSAGCGVPAWPYATGRLRDSLCPFPSK